jgi:UrcA family protein
MSVTSVQSNQRARANSLRHAIYTAFGTVTLSLLGVGAHADTLQDTQAQKTVSYSDLDLSRQNAAQMLYARLKGAAKQVCGDANGRDLRHLRELEMYQDCYKKALADAVTSVDKSSVTALYRSDANVRTAQATTSARTSS